MAATEATLSTERVAPVDPRVPTTRCPKCGNEDVWVLRVIYETRVSLQNEVVGSREQVREEVRCGRCEQKAVIGVNVGVRATQAFQIAVAQEKATCSLP